MNLIAPHYLEEVANALESRLRAGYFAFPGGIMQVFESADPEDLRTKEVRWDEHRARQALEDLREQVVLSRYFPWRMVVERPGFSRATFDNMVRG